MLWSEVLLVPFPDPSPTLHDSKLFGSGTDIGIVPGYDLGILALHYTQ